MFAFMVLMPCLFANADSIPERMELLRSAEAIRPQAQDFRWQQIPWHTDPEKALSEAKTDKRPLFVWLAGGRDRDGSPLERC